MIIIEEKQKRKPAAAVRRVAPSLRGAVLLRGNPGKIQLGSPRYARDDDGGNKIVVPESRQVQALAWLTSHLSGIFQSTSTDLLRSRIPSLITRLKSRFD